MSTPAQPRTVIVCLPADSGADWLTATTTVAEHTDHPPTLAPVFPLRRGPFRFLSRLAGRRLLGTLRRHGLITHAAGGRLRRLNLPQAGQTAWLEATARWATWQQITTGLRPATAWQVYQRRHRQAPDKFSLPDARRAFLAQPAVAAMLAHNAIPGTRQLDPHELDAYQAGQRAYATCYMLAATCGQAMLTTDGAWLQPDGDAFTDRLAYLQQAAAHLHQLPRSATVVALTT
jgi:hypothetical protein